MKKAVLKSVALGSLILTGALAASQVAMADDHERTYEVTIRNATLGQPIAPSLFVTHNSDFAMFEVGTAPDIMTDDQYFGLAVMAETGVPLALLDTVSGATGVSDAVPLLFPNNDTPDNPPIMLPGMSNSTTITASGNAKYFSAVGMLAATNDAFYAVRGVRLPKKGSVTVYGTAYDAGSEANSEAFSDIPLGGNTDEDGDNYIGVGGEGYIHVHAGIHGVLAPDPDDIAGHWKWSVDHLNPAEYDWRNPVVEITITRIDDDDD